MLVSILNGQAVRIEEQLEQGYVRVYGNQDFVGLAEAFPDSEGTQLVPKRLVKTDGRL